MHSDTGRKSCTGLFLRHGQTDYPKQRFYDDTIEDPPLNHHGIEQATLWKERLKNNHDITGLYVSPSLRTQETAKIATSALELEIKTVPGLQERSFGLWGGLSSDEVKDQFPEDWAAWKRDFIHHAPKEGESLLDFFQRVEKTVAQLRSQHPIQKFLVVAHAGTIRMLVIAALEVPLENFKRLVITNCSLTEIEYSERWPNLHRFSFCPEA
jgi:2,3-bisphosphoglycerate-dependent phosphoglycerate mutase